jgi:hypothetical protein
MVTHGSKLRASSGCRWISREWRNAVGIEGETQAGTGQLRAPSSVISLPLPVLLFSMLSLLFCPENRSNIDSRNVSIYLPDYMESQSLLSEPHIWYTLIQFTFLYLSLERSAPMLSSQMYPNLSQGLYPYNFSTFRAVACRPVARQRRRNNQL